MKRKLIGLMATLALLSSLIVPSAVFAVAPIVTIHVTAQVVSITNSRDTWELGIVTEQQILYFSANNSENVTWSQIHNTSNVHVDVELQGSDLVPVDPTYTWTLASDNGTETYELYANTIGAPTVYSIEVKRAAAYTDLIANLGEGDTYDWSMRFIAPTAFNAADDGLEKASILTLVATKSP